MQNWIQKFLTSLDKVINRSVTKRKAVYYCKIRFGSLYMCFLFFIHFKICPPVDTLDTSTFISSSFEVNFHPSIRPIWYLLPSEGEAIITSYLFTEDTLSAFQKTYSAPSGHFLLYKKGHYILFICKADIELYLINESVINPSLPIVYWKAGEGFEKEKQKMFVILDSILDTKLDFSEMSLIKIDVELLSTNIREMGCYLPAVLLYIGEVYIKNKGGSWVDVVDGGRLNLYDKTHNQEMPFEGYFYELFNEYGYVPGDYVSTLIYEIL